MIQYVHLDPKIKKQIKGLCKAGKKASNAAFKAEGIIQDLLEQGQVDEDKKNAITKHGELRIDNCRKYNLGSGYRLVTIKNGVHLFLTYMGSHDDCDQWIEKNRNFRCEPEDNRYESYRVREDVSDEDCEDEVCAEKVDMDDAEPWEEEIDESILRRIFCGLTGEKY